MFYLAQCTKNFIVLSSPSSQDEGATNLPAYNQDTLEDVLLKCIKRKKKTGDQKTTEGTSGEDKE